MIKKILFLLLVFCLANSKEVEIQSNELIKKDNFIYSNEELLLFKENYFARANSGKYNEDTKELELFGDVFIINNKQTSISSYAKINLEKSCGTFDDFFASSSFMELWLKSNKGRYEGDEFIVNKANISSCNVENPEWNISFSEGRYNYKNKDLTLKNMVLKYHGVPIFYMPYFTINTDDSRKTGFLVPRFAIRGTEAINYEQPFFWAINHRMDLELRPQIRTNRGYGIYNNFRFVDSLYSRGNFGFGYFKEFNSYAKKEDLKYSEHYGLDFHYERDRVFNENPNNQEGLYIDFLRVNDIDFLNLSSFHSNNDDAIITSKANYFYTNNKDYFGIYLKNYQDTSAINQDYTIQELPNLHYHRFYDNLFNNYVNYKFDANYSYFYRRKGSTLNRFSFYMPIEFNKSLFNDYLNFSLREELESRFNVYDNYYKNNDYAFNAIHSASIYTNLFRKYDDLAHNFTLGLSAKLRNGKNTEDEENEFFISDKYDDLQFDIEFSQLIYKNKEKKIKHSLNLYTEDSKFNYISNQFFYYINQDFFFKNTIEYSFKTSSLDRFFLEGNYKDKKLQTSLGFYYNKRNDEIVRIKPFDKYLSAKISYEFIPHNIIFSRAWYNINTKEIENYSIGITHKRKCINYTLEFKEDVSSKLTQSGIRSKKDRGIYLKFNLYPIGGVKYNVSLGNEDSYDF